MKLYIQSVLLMGILLLILPLCVNYNLDKNNIPYKSYKTLPSEENMWAYYITPLSIPVLITVEAKLLSNELQITKVDKNGTVIFKDFDKVMGLK